MMSAALLDDYLTFEALAAQAGVSLRTVHRWTKSTSPGLPYTKLGRQPLIHRADFQQWLESHRTVKNPPRAARGRN